MLFVKLEASDLQRTLGKLMDKLTNKLPLYKTWGRAVELKAKTNARGYRGRRIWRNIAGATRSTDVLAGTKPRLSYKSYSSYSSHPQSTRSAACMRASVCRPPPRQPQTPARATADVEP